MQTTALKPAERLIAAADFDPDKGDTMPKILALGQSLADSGAMLKVNVEARQTLACGQLSALVSAECGVPLFLDLKLCDIKGTLQRDGKYLKRHPPAIITVMTGVSSGAIKALKDLLPSTKVIGVTVLTDIPAEEVRALYECDIATQAMRFARHAANAGIDGLVCSPHEARLLRTFFPDIELITPGIRDPAVPVDEDEQRRTMAVADALAAGSTRLVVGRPIANAPDPSAAAKRFVGLIADALRTDK